MKNIRIKSYGKINLSIDVLGKLPNGYHQVDMVMQQIDLHDEVLVRIKPAKKLSINLKTSRFFLPVDERNLAYKAAMVFAQHYQEKTGQELNYSIRIDILKNLPIAAGLAGGSGNGAAVLLGVNKLLGEVFDLEELMKMGAELGSDVPFTLMGQARCNQCLGSNFNDHRLASSAARATGTGTDLEPLPALDVDVILSKPKHGVSTKEVYSNLDLPNIKARPNTEALIAGLKAGDFNMVAKESVNVLEDYTLGAYEKVAKTKDLMAEKLPHAHVLMSGSGPTVFGLIPVDDGVRAEDKIKKALAELKKLNRETFLTKTTL